MDRFSVVQCHHAEDAADAVPRIDNLAPEPDTAFGLDFPPEGTFDHRGAPFQLQIGTLAQNLLGKIAGGLDSYLLPLMSLKCQRRSARERFTD